MNGNTAASPTPSSFYVICDLAEDILCPLSRPLRKTSLRYLLHFQPMQSPVVTVHKHWWQPSGPLWSAHITYCPSVLHQFDCESFMGGNLERSAEAKTKPHLSSLVQRTIMVERYQVHHSWLSCCKPMFIAPAHLLVLHMCNNVIIASWTISSPQPSKDNQERSCSDTSQLP